MLGHPKLLCPQPQPTSLAPTPPKKKYGKMSNCQCNFNWHQCKSVIIQVPIRFVQDWHLQCSADSANLHQWLPPMLDIQDTILASNNAKYCTFLTPVQNCTIEWPRCNSMSQVTGSDLYLLGIEIIVILPPMIYQIHDNCIYRFM